MTREPAGVGTGLQIHGVQFDSATSFQPKRSYFDNYYNYND